MITALLIAIFVLCSCASVTDIGGGMASDDWTIHRGSPSLCGYVDRALPDKPKVAWTYANDVRTVASPIICGGNAYTCDRQGMIRCVNSDGRLIWKHSLNTPVEASFIISDSILYVGRIDGFLTALSLSDGRTLWEYETLGQISASPNIIRPVGGDELLLVGSYDNSMYSLSTATGEKVCQYSTGYYINGAAAVWNEFAVFGGCDGWLRMVNTVSGEQTDSVELKGYVPSSPAIMDGKAYVCDYYGNLYEEELLGNGRFGNQRILIKADTDDASNSGAMAMPAVSPQSVFLLTADRHLLCIDRKDGSQRWSCLLRGETGESAPIVCRDKVLVCTKDGHVTIHSASDGTELWHYEVGEQIIASPAVISGGFFIMTSRGRILKII